MPRANRKAIGFVRALVAGGKVSVDAGGRLSIVWGERTVTLEATEAQALISDGVLDGNRIHCRAGKSARTWLRRQLAETEEFPSQHRTLVTTATGRVLNLEESPLARLAVVAPGEVEPFLQPHHVEAGERVRRLAERAQLQPRVTMSYDAGHAAGGKGAGTAAEIGDLAADARRQLAEIHRVLPRDCAGVVLDVCGLLKGLQTVERERGWPRRSAKLVLRIGLDQLARHYGYGSEATGPTSRRDRTWVGEGARPTRFE